MTASRAGSIPTSGSPIGTQTASTPPPLSELGPVFRRDPRPRRRRRPPSYNRGLAIMQALSRPPVWRAMLPLHGGLAIAEMRLPRRSSGSARFIGRTVNNKGCIQPSGLRGFGRRPRISFSIGFPRGRLERHAGRSASTGLRRPRRASHHLAYDGNDAGLHGVIWRGYASGHPKIRIAFLEAAAVGIAPGGPHGPPFR